MVSFLRSDTICSLELGRFSTKYSYYLFTLCYWHTIGLMHFHFVEKSLDGVNLWHSVSITLQILQMYESKQSPFSLWNQFLQVNSSQHKNDIRVISFNNIRMLLTLFTPRDFPTHSLQGVLVTNTPLKDLLSIYVLT